MKKQIQSEKYESLSHIYLITYHIKAFKSKSCKTKGLLCHTHNYSEQLTVN
jgi:hypothetical protein